MEKTQGLQWEIKMKNEKSILVVRKNRNRFACYGKAYLFGIWYVGIQRFGTIKWNRRNQEYCFEQSVWTDTLGIKEVASIAKAMEDINKNG